jgi:hypothetical protein
MHIGSVGRQNKRKTHAGTLRLAISIHIFFSSRENATFPTFGKKNIRAQTHTNTRSSVFPVGIAQKSQIFARL